MFARESEAVDAASVKSQFMAVDLEALGGEGLQACRAALGLEDPAAEAAFEMMMVMLASDLVPVIFTWQLHGGEQTLLEHRLDGAIDRGNAQSGHLGLGDLQDLGGQERAVSRAEGGLNGSTLAGLAFKNSGH